MKNKKLFKLASMIGVLVLGLVFMTAFAFAGESAPKGNAIQRHFLSAGTMSTQIIPV